MKNEGADRHQDIIGMGYIICIFRRLLLISAESRYFL